MNHPKIGIVEAETNLAETIANQLQKLGYRLAPVANNYQKALKMIEDESPDLILLNTNLKGENDGIEIAQHIRTKYFGPIIFFSSTCNPNIMERTKKVNPNAFLLEPFTQDNLFAGIEMALFNHQNKIAQSSDSILVKDGYIFIRVILEQIMFINSEHNYSTFHLINGRKVMVRSTLSDMFTKLDPKRFKRINRGVIINADFITKIENAMVFIEEIGFSVAKKIRTELISLLENRTYHQISMN